MSDTPDTQDEYETDDMTTVAWLLYNGYRHSDVFWDDMERKVIWVFLADTILPNLVRQLRTETANVEPLRWQKSYGAVHRSRRETSDSATR